MLRRYGLLIASFLGLALVATWPLVARIGAQVPGSDTWAYDEYTFVWSMWWFKHSLIDLRSSIFFSQNIFYPLGMELILYSYNLMAAILALPLGVAANWAFAANVSLLFSIVISGVGAYLLALWTLRGRTGARWVALIAGVIYAFASNRAIYLALGHYNIHSVHYLPIFVLYLLRLVERPTRRNMLMAGLFAAFNLLVDMQFGVFMAFLGACLLLTKPLRARLFRRPVPWRGWLALVGTGILAILFTWPYFWETVKSIRQADFLLAGWGDALKLSADLAGWFTPTALHPLGGVDWPRYLRAVQDGTAPFTDVNTVFLGYATVALAMVGGVALWRRARGWIVAALVSALFTLGPLLQVRGQSLFDFDGLRTSIPLPFLLLHYIPFVQGNRTANRWSIVLMLALAMLAAHGVAAMMGGYEEWMRRRGEERDRRRPATSPHRQTTSDEDGRTLTKDEGRNTPHPSEPGTRHSAPTTRLLLPASLSLLALILILFEHAAIPLPQTDARIPPAVQQLAALPDGAVLQIPLGWRNSFGVLGAEDTRAQYYMSAHGKPILSGNTSRNPAIKFDYFRRLPLVEAITHQEFGETPSPDLLAAARAQASELITLWGVRYLLLLPATPNRLPYADTWQASQQLALDLIPHSSEPIIDDGRIRVYAVQPGAPLPLALDFGGQTTDAWRGAGWSVDEADVGGASGIWATSQRAQLLFRSEDASPRRLSFGAAPFAWPNAPAQMLSIELNGRRLGRVQMGEGWQDYSFEITPRPGINHVWLEFSRADSPRVVLSQAMIGATGVQGPVDIDVHAFEQAYITLTDATGVETPASAGRQGYNCTVLDPNDGRVLDQQGFDTVANGYEVARMVDYLNHLPDGRVVILATRAGAGAFVSPDLIAALRRLGSAVADPAALQGQAHALVGVAGAAPGAAAEVIAPADAFLRISGDFRPLAAAFDWLHIE